MLVEKNKDQKGLVLTMLGFGGFKEQHLEIVAKAFKEKGFIVVRFDTTKTISESDGNYIHC